MTTAIALFTDGRDHVFDERFERGWATMLTGGITERWCFNDSGDPGFAVRLKRELGPAWNIISWSQRLGFAGTISAAWQLLAQRSTADHIFHLEDDFVPVQEVNVDVLAGALYRHPHLVQLALRRQPWNENEIAAGGIVELNPDAYSACYDGHIDWLEHRLFFTTNPSLYRRTLTKIEWPLEEHSEGKFSHRILRRGTPEVGGQQARFAFYGTLASGVWVEHIGTQRAGTGY